MIRAEDIVDRRDADRRGSLELIEEEIRCKEQRRDACESRWELEIACRSVGKPI